MIHIQLQDNPLQLLFLLYILNLNRNFFYAFEFFLLILFLLNNFLKKRKLVHICNIFQLIHQEKNYNYLFLLILMYLLAYLFHNQNHHNKPLNLFLLLKIYCFLNFLFLLSFLLLHYSFKFFRLKNNWK